MIAREIFGSTAMLNPRTGCRQDEVQLRLLIVGLLKQGTERDTRLQRLFAIIFQDELEAVRGIEPEHVCGGGDHGLYRVSPRKRPLELALLAFDGHVDD